MKQILYMSFTRAEDRINEISGESKDIKQGKALRDVINQCHRISAVLE